MSTDPRSADPLSDEELRALQELLEGAVPGPWDVTIARPQAPIDVAGQVILATVCTGWQGDKTIHITCADDDAHARPHPRLNDARLMALAPSLASEVLTLRAAAASMEAEAKRLDGNYRFWKDRCETTGRKCADLESRLAASDAVVEAAREAFTGAYICAGGTVYGDAWKTCTEHPNCKLAQALAAYDREQSGAGRPSGEAT